MSLFGMFNQLNDGKLTCCFWKGSALHFDIFSITLDQMMGYLWVYLKSIVRVSIPEIAANTKKNAFVKLLKVAEFPKLALIHGIPLNLPI